MYRRLTKYTPILIVGAALGFLCWPYVDDHSPRPKEVDSTKALKSLVASLSPPEAPAPERDPFDSRATVRSGKWKADTAVKKPTPVVAAEKKPTPSGIPSQTASVPFAAAKTSRPRGPVDLALQATHLRGDRRIALINGAVYTEGDEIKPKGPTAATYTVNRIYPHRVVLETNSQTLELAYPAHDAKPKTGSRGTAQDNPPKTSTARMNPRKTGLNCAMPETAELNGSLPLIVRLLFDKGLLDSKKLVELSEFQSKDASPVEAILVKKGLARDHDIAQAYAEYLVSPLFELEANAPPPDRSLVGLLPEKLCRDQLIVPVAVEGHKLQIAFASPNEMLIIDEVQLVTGMTVQPVIAARSVIEGLIEALYSGRDSAKGFMSQSEDFEQVEDDNPETVEDDDSDEVLHLDQPPPPGRDGRVIRMVNQILEQALRNGASDIHLEPFEEGCKVRLRIDGALHELPPPSRALFIPIVSRFKILAKMDIAEKRVPQDGAIALKHGEKRVDLRVSSVPTVYGEKIVMRILDKGAIPVQLTGLGFDERQSKDLIESIQSPHGLMLVTGPTGSGKSTTLYACLNYLNESDTNICTVEDPVEYKFHGMNQVQVKTQVGLTFAGALRAFLRQDPDIIMVGEVRDQETAQICLRAALTGHFVLSTIHTNDSLSAVSRLQDMGVEPFLLAATLRVLEAQRLIRRLCKECKEPYDCDAEIGRLHGFETGQPLMRPKGCDACRGTGYRGRVGIFEVVRITPRMAELIQSRTPLPDLRRAACEEGMKMLADSAIDKVRTGLTSLEEALAVTMASKE